MSLGNVLFIAHRIPYPPNKGDKIRSFHMLQHLAKHYRVTVACMVDDSEDVKYVDALKDLVHQVFHVVRSPFTMKLKAIGSLVSGEPFTKPCFYSDALQNEIDGFLDNNDVKAVLCFCSSSAEYVFRSRHHHKTLQDTVLLADLVDVDSEKWGQYAEHKSGPMRWLYRREDKLLRTYEQRIVKSFQRTFLVSDSEKALLRDFDSFDKVEALSNGVDLEYFSPDKVSKELHPTAENKLVFSGAMDYWPNIEGAVWFAKKIFPLIKESVPQAVFCVAGRNPSDEVIALKKINGVEITGTVPDMREHLSTASICVVPLLIARGIQNKVLEAMAMEKPVVATTGAATGTKAVDGEDLIVVDNEQEMAEAIIALLNDKARQVEVGSKGRAYVEREHSWDAHLNRLVELIEDSGLGSSS